MNSNKEYPPQDEQDICVECGFCCDNTLFEYASIDEKDELYGHFKDTKFELDGSNYFKLPCAYFKTCCTIYDQDKPKICSSFRCKLLRNFEKGDLTKEKALEIVENAKHLRDEILSIYSEMYPNKLQSFRSVLKFVNTNETEQSKEFQILKAKTNLLSILLIKYFKSKKTFDEFLSNINE